MVTLDGYIMVTLVDYIMVTLDVYIIVTLDGYYITHNGYTCQAEPSTFHSNEFNKSCTV